MNPVLQLVAQSCDKLSQLCEINPASVAQSVAQMVNKFPLLWHNYANENKLHARRLWHEDEN